MDKNFLDCLAPCIDDIRSLHKEFGTRPYKIYIVKSGWSEGRINEGTLQQISKIEIIPNPKLEQFNELTNKFEICSEVIEGKIKISEISSSYTRFQLDPQLAIGQVSNIIIEFEKSNIICEASIDYISYNMRNVPGWTIFSTVRQIKR